LLVAAVFFEEQYNFKIIYKSLKIRPSCGHKSPAGKILCSRETNYTITFVIDIVAEVCPLFVSKPYEHGNSSNSGRSSNFNRLLHMEVYRVESFGE
jgi:hypothetical protein